MNTTEQSIELYIANFSKSFGKCSLLGDGVESVAILCADKVYKVFHCDIGKPHPFNLPPKATQLWNTYYRTRYPEWATAKHTTASELFPGAEWPMCNHDIVVTPYIKGRPPASRKEAEAIMDDYAQRDGRAIQDPEMRGNLKVPTGKDRGVVIDFGTSVSLRGSSVWKDYYEKYQRPVSQSSDIQDRSFSSKNFIR